MPSPRSCFWSESSVLLCCCHVQGVAQLSEPYFLVSLWADHQSGGQSECGLRAELWRNHASLPSSVANLWIPVGTSFLPDVHAMHIWVRYTVCLMSMIPAYV